MSKLKKTGVTDDDIMLFENAVKGTQKLSQKKIRAQSTPKKPILRRKQAVDIDTEAFNFNEAAPLKTVQGHEFINYKQDHVSHKLLRNLAKGQYNVEAILDLHGLSVDQARVAVSRFLQLALSENKQVVLIIHGKGQDDETPILKNKLNHWLRQVKAVLGFCSASPLHGSRGAVYILLKRTRGELKR